MSEKRKTPADYIAEGAGFADVTLSRPMKTESGERSVLRMREPTAADVLAAQDSSGSEGKREVALFANLCEVTPDMVGALPLRDYVRLQAAYALFTV